MSLDFPIDACPDCGTVLRDDTCRCGWERPDEDLPPYPGIDVPGIHGG